MASVMKITISAIELQRVVRIRMIKVKICFHSINTILQLSLIDATC